MKALVTGASSGNGRATALALASHGAFTLIHYHNNSEGASATLESIRAAGGQGELLQSADLRCTEGVHQLIQQINETTDQVDILINNAGSLLRRAPFLDLSEELWNEVMMLNLTSAFHITQALLPGMIKRKRGFIVNVSSVAARTGGGIGSIAYSAAKGALSTMTKGLAKEFAQLGIRVNAVSPGTVDTNYHKQFSTARAIDAVIASTPMGRLGTPDEVADLVVFLCSKGARFIQGQVIEINGGFLMV